MWNFYVVFLLSRSYDKHIVQTIELTGTRSGFKTLDQAQGQEAHLNQYNQMCYPAYAGAQADEKAQHTW